MPKWDSVTIYAQWLNDEADFGHTIHCRCFILSLFFERVRACIYICIYCVFFCQSAFAFRSASSRIQLMKSLTVVVSADVVLSSPLWRYLFAFFISLKHPFIFLLWAQTKWSFELGGNDGNICA